MVTAEPRVSGLSILAAEDNPDHRRLIRATLEAADATTQVEIVATGQALLAELERKQFDCVVIDFKLPDFEAAELVELAAPHLGGCPVVVISASRTQRIVVESFRRGVRDFVSKEDALFGDTLWRSIEQAVLDAERRQEERRRYERRENYLLRLTETDQLTGLGNRRYLQRCIEAGRWTHDRRKVLSLVMIDLDRFKSVNDEHGHSTGDRALRHVANHIQRHLHGSDLAVRWGGEEFLILRPSATLADSICWAEELRAAIARSPICADGSVLRVTASMGVHETIVDQLEESAITACDKALYLAKDFGRNRVCTTMMTEVERLLDETGKDDERSPLEKLAGFLDKLADQLGAVQKEHLFDHARLVARTAEHIARLMQVDRRGCQQARIAGLAHDIGKCIVPEQILAKPGPLTLTERSVVALHSEFGGRIAGRLGLGQTIEQAICTHHERYDISRSRIPRRQLDRSVLGRILCASDALVAMTSQRPYADAMDRGAALREMRQQSGLQFDPDVVEAAHFVELRTAA